MADVRQERVQRLKAARQQDSKKKNGEVLAALQRLKNDGTKLNVARVARAAGVSTWLIYNTPELLAVTKQAIEDQRSAPSEAEQSSARSTRVSSESLRADAAILREENRELRKQVADLRKRLQSQLGAEVESSSSADLLARIQGLSDLNGQLSRDLATAVADKARLSDRLEEVEGELEGAQGALQRMMREANRVKQQ